MKVLLAFITVILFIQCAGNDKPMKIHAIRLKPGQDLKKEIEHFVVEHKLASGWIVTAVGSLTQTHLRYANRPDGEKKQGHFEVVSLVGTLSQSGCHLHASVSDSTGATIGGHLMDGNIIYTTMEIVIGEGTEMIFTREKDGTTEWPELQIRKKP